MNFIYNLYHKVSKWEIVKKFAKIYRNGFFVSNILAYKRAKYVVELQKKEKKDKIRVVFLCQYTQSWSKISPVYEQMKSDSRFETYIVTVYDDVCGFKEEDTFNYISNLGYDNIVRTTDSTHIYDIKELNPQYVFYQRPYDRYLPEEYRSNIVSKYAKIAYISYGYILTKDAVDMCMAKLFFRNVYLFFAENKINCEYNINRLKYSHKKGYRKSLNIGYPAFEDFMKYKNSRVEAEDVRLLWTPRWSDDKEVGGSNFLVFKDEIVKLVEKENGISVIFRPHPLTFAHFISENKMTKEEADNYLNLYKNSEKLVYDDSKNYAKTFWNADILLTDPSSIIVDYFLTGKPIIYCDTGMKPDKVFEKMIEAMYVVKTWDEAKAVIKKLLEGKDELRDLREKRIIEIFGDNFDNISKNIVDTIANDYFEK